jgi:WD40-like Beta Propeller Repeat
MIPVAKKRLLFLSKGKIKVNKAASIFSLFVLVPASLFTQPSDFPRLAGPYLGQKPPGMTPEIFAPGILSPFSMLHGKLVFSPDGLEAFWTCNAAPVQSRWTARQTPQGIWPLPEPAFLSIEYVENSMVYSADGNRLYFHSRRPIQGTGAPKDKDIWYREKTSKGWGDPVPLGPPVNLPSTDESAPSLASDGTLFFSRQESTGAHGAPGHGAGQIDIYYSEWKNGAYMEPVRMGPEINTEHPEIDPVIAPDKSYLLFTSARPDGYSRMMNLYVSFRTTDGRWTPALSLSHTLKIDNIWFPSLSTDGAYLFFCGGYPTEKGYTDSRYYWVSTKILDRLRPQGATSLSPLPSDIPKLTGPYLGQKPPGMTPEVFAPGIVSTENGREFSGAFSPDGREYYFFRVENGVGLMLVSRLTGGQWSAPQRAPFDAGYMDREPHITRDGKRLFFCSNRPYPGSGDQRIMSQVWVMEREGDSWGPPQHLGMGMFPSTSDKGNIFVETRVSKLVDNKLVEVGRLEDDPAVPSDRRLPRQHTFMAPDESFYFFDANQNLYVSFRTKEGQWGKPVDLSKKMGLPGGWLPTLSPDNQYLFFAYRDDIYWISAKILEGLRAEENR